MKKHLKKIIYCLILIVICTANYLLSNYYIKKTLNITEVYVASHNIEGRHLISEEDIKTVLIPYMYIDQNAFCTKEEIIGKYTDIQGKIPAGSLFYKSMLFDVNDLPDSPILQLKEEQVAFTLLTDVLSLSGNSIVSGQRVNLYGSINLGQNKFIEDLIAENVRVISIKDSKGYNLDHPSSNKIPFSITLAIHKDSLKYLSLLLKIGKIDLYANSMAYDFQNEATLNTDSIIINYIDENY